MQQHGKTFQAFLPGIPLGMRLLFVHRPEHIKHILSDGFKLGKYGKGDFIRGTIAISLNRISRTISHLADSNSSGYLSINHKRRRLL